MDNAKRFATTWRARLLGLASALALAGSGAAFAAAVTFNLSAKAGTTVLPPNGAGAPPVVSVWGYVDTTSNPAVTKPGGPTLVVNQGDVVTVNLTNTLPAATAMLFQGQSMVPDLTGASASGGTKVYTFTASSAGTFLYEAGLLANSQYQAAMGLYGALVVRPTGWPLSAPGQAYGDAATAFDSEALLVLSEIDMALNNSATPADFDMRDYSPTYFLINGKSYPDTDAIAGTAGSKVLLRYVNAGIRQHSMGTLGLRQKFVAKDGSVLPTLNHNVTAESLAPGQTGDAITTVPASTVNGSKFAVYDAALMLQNNGSSNSFGGMLAFVSVSSTSAPGPTVTAIGLLPDLTSLTATLTASSGRTVNAAEYWIDGGAHTAFAGTFGSTTASVAASIPAQSGGSHTVFVRGQDDTLVWGLPRSVSFVTPGGDSVGPTATSTSVPTPNPSDGSVPVAFAVSISDVSTGGSNVIAAEYFIDTTGAAGTGTAMSISTPSPTVTINESIQTATLTLLTNGAHTISVRGKDANNNWGPFATMVFQVAKALPTTSGVTVAMTPNNGTRPLSASQPVVRVTATNNSAASTVAAAEAFIDTVGTSGTGIPMLPGDGAFNSGTEVAYFDIPLTTVSVMSAGSHPIYVHARDALGNWGATASATLVVDKTTPVFSGFTASPNPTYGAASIALTVAGSDASGIAGGEYWIDTAAPAAGGGTPFTGTTTGSIPLTALADGNHTIGARIRDVAGNWSGNTQTTTLVKVPDPIFANGFETGTTVNSWGWSSDTGANNATGLARINATAGAAMVGAQGLQAQGNNTNYVQYDFSTPAYLASSTYDARFYFNPNGNSSTGKDIFAAATTSGFGTIVFHVRYRLSSGQAQVQVQDGATANASWVNVNNASSNVIEVVWQAAGSAGPAPGTLTLYVNGVLSQTVATSSTSSVGAVRLGSVTATGNATTMYFDAFSSKRKASPLIGP